MEIEVGTIEYAKPDEFIVQITGCGVELYALSNYGRIYSICDDGFEEWCKVEDIPFKELNKE